MQTVRGTSPWALALAVILALSLDACSPLREQGGVHGAPVPAARPWWNDSAAVGDPLLAALVAQGLASGGSPACAPPSQGFFARVTHKLHPAAARQAQIQRWEAAEDRLARAQLIAVAYGRARLWQARLALRRAAPAMLRDNAEIAHFRREAGLVAGLDEDMAGIMLGLNGAAVDRAAGEYAAALHALAGLTGQDEAGLGQRLAAAPALAPPPPVNWPDVPQDRPDLRALALRQPVPAGQWAAALDHARGQLAGAHQALEQARQQAAARADLAARAQKALANARLGYRNGAASFASLFAAEAAGLAAQEAEAEARDALWQASVQLWTVQGRGETPQGHGCD